MEETINIQKVWGWEKAVHLFLIGAGAGAYLAGFILTITRPELILLSRATISTAAPLLIVGLIFMIWQLGQKANVTLAFLRPMSSWITRGVIIMTIFIVLDVIHIIGIWIAPSTWLGSASGVYLGLGALTSVFAIFALIYTGMVLKVLKPFPFWGTLGLPVLFLISGVSAGVMCVALVISVYGLFAEVAVTQQLIVLASYNAFIIIVEALAIGFYLWRAGRIKAAKVSVHAVIRGCLAAGFWGGVVAAGMVIPFIFAVYQVYVATNDIVILIMAVVSSIIGLAGGYMLRYIVIAGGTSTPLNVEGVLVTLPEVSRATVSRRVAF